jgi:class 3 adenylate cyclase
VHKGDNASTNGISSRRVTDAEWLFAFRPVLNGRTTPPSGTVYEPKPTHHQNSSSEAGDLTETVEAGDPHEPDLPKPRFDDAPDRNSPTFGASARLVTVVFVDVERSTELLIERGDAEGTAVIDAVLDAVGAQVEPHGGRLVKSLGDGMMVVFPAPRQAVSFAVAVQQALAGTLPQVRIGVNTGEVVDERDDPVGEAVHAAARITAKAAGGETLVSDVVRQLVGSMPGLRFVDRGRKRLRGFPERWRVFELRGERRHRSVWTSSIGAARWRT